MINVWISVRRIYILFDISDPNYLPLALGLGIPSAFFLVMIVYYVFAKLKHKENAVEYPGRLTMDEVRILKNYVENKAHPRFFKGRESNQREGTHQTLLCRPPRCVDQT